MCELKTDYLGIKFHPDLRLVSEKKKVPHCMSKLQKSLLIIDCVSSSLLLIMRRDKVK